MTAIAESARTGSPAGLLDHATEALTGARRHAAVIVALAAYGAVWFVYRIVSTLPRDIHFDMSELYAWSQMPAFGYDKHPPLSAFVVRLWFAVFPVNDLSFILLVVLNIAVTLYIAWRILERWTDPMKSAFGIALLMMIPFYNFHALKYNANTVLLPVWAFTAYAFLRAYETHRAKWALLAGAAAGAAMLGKYWSVFLVAGFVIAALADRRRRVFFFSPAPYLMVLAGSVVIAPHVFWLFTDGDTLAYAGKRFEDHVPFSVGAALKYVAGIVGYASMALALWALILKPTPAALRDSAWPHDPQRRLALLGLVLPNLLPTLVARWSELELTSLWALPGYSLLPLVLLASPKIEVDRTAVRWMILIVVIGSLMALMSSPLAAFVLHMHGDPRPNDYGSLLARDVAAHWGEISDRPLPAIFSCGDSSEVAMAVAYDLRLPTRVLHGKHGVGANVDLLTRGGAIVGAQEDSDCAEEGPAMMAIRPDTERFAPSYRPKLFGVAGKPFSYTAYVVPPP